METKEQSKIQKLMKSKPAKAGVSVALVGTLALAGIGAYFTGTDTVENKFDISAGLTDKITVVEENWDTTDADDNGIPDAAVYGKEILDNLACRNSTLWQRTCRP